METPITEDKFDFQELKWKRVEKVPEKPKASDPRTFFLGLSTSFGTEQRLRGLYPWSMRELDFLSRWNLNLGAVLSEARGNFARDDYEKRWNDWYKELRVKCIDLVLRKALDDENVFILLELSSELLLRKKKRCLFEEFGERNHFLDSIYSQDDEKKLEDIHEILCCLRNYPRW